MSVGKLQVFFIQPPSPSYECPVGLVTNLWGSITPNNVVSFKDLPENHRYKHQVRQLLHNHLVYVSVSCGHYYKINKLSQSVL